MATGRVKSIEELSEELAMTKYWNYSDDQLKEIMDRNLKLIPALINSNNESQMIEGKRLLGELNGCGKILDQRKAVADRKSAELEKFKKELVARREAAILNLPYSSSANGQLVVSILEEEPFKCMDESELRSWYEELEMLDDEEWFALLNGLVSEGVIRIDSDENYYIFSSLDDSLLVGNENCALLLATCGSRKRHLLSEEDLFIAALIMTNMKERGYPLSDEEMLALCNQFGFTKTERDIYHLRTTLIQDGILSGPYLRNKYYIRMFGEERRLTIKSQ